MSLEVNGLNELMEQINNISNNAQKMEENGVELEFDHEPTHEEIEEAIAKKLLK